MFFLFYILLVYSTHELRSACMRCFGLFSYFITYTSIESPNMDILDQLNWSPGRRWIARGTTWTRRGSILLGCAGWVEEIWCTLDSFEY